MKKKNKTKNGIKRKGTESFVTFQIFRTKFSFLHYGPDRTKITQQWKNTFSVMNLHFTKEEATRAHSLIFLQYTKQLN